MVANYLKKRTILHFLKSLNLIKNSINFQATILGSGELYNEIKNIISNFKLNKKIRIIRYKKNPSPVYKKFRYLNFKFIA